MRGNLVMYDVRGIQSYIFRTNTMKEIIGASQLVDGKIMELFKAVVDKEEHPLTFDFDWKNNKNNFIQTQNDIEVIYEGGGNIIAYFKDQEIMNSINRKLSLALFKNMSGLSLAVASVEMTDNYEKDRNKLMRAMDKIKAMNSMISPMGNLPITMQDPMTGLPLCKNTRELGHQLAPRKISLESFQKLEKYFYEVSKESKENRKKYALEFDDMVKEKGEDSYIAVVHIDGNSMGNRIKNILENTVDYGKAVSKMRNISSSIYKTFDVDGLNAIDDKLDELVNNNILKLNNGRYPYRKIISAGDDITFVFRADLALTLVEAYIHKVQQGYMYIETEDKDKDKYKCSCCAGITLMHSHFPFSVAYEYAEACCGSAKQVAKANKINNKVGNYVDFQVVYSGLLTNVEELRKRNYTNGKYTLCKRPYDIDNLNSECKLEDFKKSLKTVQELPRSWAKRFRDAYYEDKSVLLTEIKAAKSRGYSIGEEELYDENNIATYYDALEMMDMWGDEYE
ncbi:MAG: hypothetical protein RR252_02255 [Longicatena sp.]